MSRKSKVTADERIATAKACTEGKMSQSEASRRLDVDESTIRNWIARYKAGGPLALKNLDSNQVYSSALKEKAVQEYLDGKGALRDIAAKYGLRSESQLKNWIKVYNSGKDFGRKISGGSRMTTSRKTTQEERIQIVKECLENGSNYGDTAIKYNVSYQQVYTWVKRYAELSEAGLEDRRGKRTVEQEPRSEVEEFKVKLAKLEHELYMTKMERDLLKKVEELERGDVFRK